MSQEKVYCRVRDGKIVDYPVYAHYIRNRSHPVSLYTPVVFDPKPEIDEFQYLEEHLEIVGDVVRATYTVHTCDLQTVLNCINGVEDDDMGMDEEGNEIEVTPVAIKDVPARGVEVVSELARQLAQDRLDKWAQERDYDGVLSVASYATSTLPNFQLEGQRAVELRDQSWAALYQYLNEVISGQAPVPTTVEEIEARLPELSWAE